jgi:acyl transferase domain-containing protein
VLGILRVFIYYFIYPYSKLLSKYLRHCDTTGEIAAAYATGALDAKQAILYAYFRGVSVSGLKLRGTMLAVGLSPEDVEPYLEDGIRIACYNSPESLTLSGDEEVALRVKAKLEDARIFVREVKTNGRAYHSHHMQSVGGDYEELANAAIDRMGASERRKHEKNVRLPTFISSVTGVEKHAFYPNASYWRQNLESPVRFSQAVTRALAIEDLGINHLIEIGPHSALAGPVRQLKDALKLTSRDLDYTPSLVRGESSVTKLLELAGNLFIKGYPVNLAQVNAVQKMVNGAITTKPTFTIVDLPRYSWNYANGTNLRHENRVSAELRTRKFPRHDLLGTRVLGSIRDKAQWRNLLDAHDLPWLEQHKVRPQ